MTQTVALIFAGLGALAALIFNLRARSAAGEASKAWAENEKLSGDLKSVRDQLGKQSTKLAKHDEEVAGLRKRLDKAKRRGGASGGSGGSGGGGESVSATLVEREAELEEARQARDAARSEAEGLTDELRRLRTELAAKPQEEPSAESVELEELRQAGAKAAQALAESTQAQEELRAAKARLKKKVDTQELLYVALRTELEAKKDRLRGQQELIERLQALEVSLGGGSARAEAAAGEADSVRESESQVDSSSAASPEGPPETEPGPEDISGSSD